MPSIKVPLSHPTPPIRPPPAPTISISYRVLGTGPVLVLMIPGMCVPASMYDSMAAVLAATSQFTAVVLDNRGIGLSDAPPAALLAAPGYTARNLAADAWRVVDAVRTPAALHPDVALVGHSMGGMIVQAMLELRPKRVRFAAFLSTHAGGLWNMLPTTRMVRAILRVAWSGFDRDVNAAANLNLHFTQSFLDAWVVHDFHDDHDLQHIQAPHHSEDSEKPKQDLPSRPAGADSKPPADPADPDTCSHHNDTLRLHPPTASTASLGHAHAHGLGYLESKVLELVRDARIYFGLTRSFKDKLWKPQKTLLEAVTKRRRQRARRRRREIYHAKYTGAETPDSHLKPEKSTEPSSTSLTCNPEDSPHAMYGHAAVVRSHSLSRSMATRLKQCTRVFKLVMTGRHDKVVTPSSSRALAAAIGANTVVEVEAAHFITDEAAAEVTTHVMYGLRKAFFARNGIPCECEWCVGEKEDEPTQDSSCRLC